MAESSEQVLLQRNDVTVTQYRFTVENETYSIQNITSIRHDVDQPETPEDNHYRDLTIIGWIMAGFFFLVLIMGLGDAEDGQGWTMEENGVAILGLLGFIAVGLGIGLYGWVGRTQEHRLPEFMRRWHVPPVTPPATHTVVLTSSAQERKVLSSKDGEFITAVIDALNRAFVLKG